MDQVLSNATWAIILLVEALSSHPPDKRNVGVQFWEVTSAVLNWQSANELLPAGHVLPNNVIVSQLPSAGPVSTADLQPQETCHDSRHGYLLACENCLLCSLS